MRKAKITGEVVVMEVSQATLGVRTRARTLALQNLQSTSSSTTSAYLQLRSRRLEKPLIVADEEDEKKPPKEGCKQKCSSNSRLESASVISGSVGSVSLSFLKNGEEEGLLPGVEASWEENVLEYEGRERWGSLILCSFFALIYLVLEFYIGSFFFSFFFLRLFWGMGIGGNGFFAGILNPRMWVFLVVDMVLNDRVFKNLFCLRVPLSSEELLSDSCFSFKRCGYFEIVLF